MIFAIEPGLYFGPSDLLAPPELRGIGVRIEDDVLVTEDGCENLSAMLPRQPVEIEAWMASLLPACAPAAAGPVPGRPGPGRARRPGRGSAEHDQRLRVRAPAADAADAEQA